MRGATEGFTRGLGPGRGTTKGEGGGDGLTHMGSEHRQATEDRIDGGDTLLIREGGREVMTMSRGEEGQPRWVARRSNRQGERGRKSVELVVMAR